MQRHQIAIENIENEHLRTHRSVLEKLSPKLQKSQFFFFFFKKESKNNNYSNSLSLSLSPFRTEEKWWGKFYLYMCGILYLLYATIIIPNIDGYAFILSTFF